MQQTEFQRFAEMWTSAWEMCGKRVTPGLLKLAFNALAHYDLDAIAAALGRHVRDADSGQFAPKPADIVRQIEGGGDDRSLAAWSKVEQAIRNVGPWKRIAFDDARIHAVLAAMGGWSRFVAETEDALPFTRNEFCKRYRPLIQNPPTHYPPYLIADGGSGEPVVFLGDEGKAQEVLYGGAAGGGMAKIGQIVDNEAKRLGVMK